jgi:hypothetical protein
MANRKLRLNLHHLVVEPFDVGADHLARERGTVGGNIEDPGEMTIYAAFCGAPTLNAAWSCQASCPDKTYCNASCVNTCFHWATGPCEHTCTYQTCGYATAAQGQACPYPFE